MKPLLLDSFRGPRLRAGEACEVEFLALNGEFVAVTALPATQVRPIERRRSLTLVEA